MMSPLYLRAMSAVGFTSMSVRSCSYLPPALPRPTMLMKASTRVLERSITMSFMCSKLRQPAPPGSATVVTPARKLNPSGYTMLLSARNPWPTVGR